MFKLLFQLIASYLQKWGILKTKTTDEDVKEFLEPHSKQETPEPVQNHEPEQTPAPEQTPDT